MEAAPGGLSGAPPPRRRGLSGLRRRLSQTFRLSFHGSLSELASQAPTFTIAEVSRDDELAAEFGGDDFDELAKGDNKRNKTSKTNKEPSRRGEKH